MADVCIQAIFVADEADPDPYIKICLMGDKCPAKWRSTDMYRTWKYADDVLKEIIIRNYISWVFGPMLTSIVSFNAVIWFKLPISKQALCFFAWYLNISYVVKEGFCGFEALTKKS